MASLSTFILSDMERVLAEWDQFAGMIPGTRKLDREALRDHAEEILATIARDMLTAQTGDQQTLQSRGLAERVDDRDTAAETHGRHRHEAGFDLNQMVSEYRALRATVLRLWEQTLDRDRAAGLQELIRFNEGIDQAMAESVARFMQDLGRARELMLAVLAHDVRSPLGAIVQSGNALLHDAELDPKHAQAARIVVSSGTRISGMVATLLDVARVRLGGLLPITCAPIDVADVCRRVAGEVEAAHPGRHVLVDASGDTEGFWDAERLEQLLSNLLENAVTYGDPVRPITVKADGTRPHVRLCVQNHGLPIPAGRLDRIFDPLMRVEPAASSRRSGSLGLGLFIVREIARAHGGSISVTSDAERGTEFETYLPRRSEST